MTKLKYVIINIKITELKLKWEAQKISINILDS